MSGARKDPGDREAFEQGRNQERWRLAREVHDRVLQSLANVGLRLDATRRRLRQRQEEPPTELELSAEELRASIRELREVLTESNDASSWQPGTLVPEIEAELRELSQSTNIRFDVRQTPANLTLYDAMVEREVFLATREALRNLVKHSGATRARLRIKLTPDALTVSLRDNGTGFHRTESKCDARTDHDEVHYGLESMASRIRDLGGHIRTSSGRAGGTTLIMSVPTNHADSIGRPSGWAGWITRDKRVTATLGAVAAAGGLGTAILLFHGQMDRRSPSSPPGRIAPADRGAEETNELANPLELAADHYKQASDQARQHWSYTQSPFDRLDLSAWGYRLISRRTREALGLTTRAFVYRHQKTGKLLIAEEFRGARIVAAGVIELTSPDDEYLTRNEDGLHSVAWGENDSLYVLTASSPSIAELLAIAHAITWEHQLAGNFLD